MTELDAIGKVCLALHARMTARILSRAYEAALRPAGLKVPQFGILGAIGHGTALSETALAERLGLERTTLVRNLKVLAEKGWIEPIASERRTLRHQLTPQGRAKLEAAIPLWEQAQQTIESRLGSGDADRARRSMRALRKAAYPR